MKYLLVIFTLYFVFVSQSCQKGNDPLPPNNPFPPNDSIPIISSRLIDSVILVYSYTDTTDYYNADSILSIYKYKFNYDALDRIVELKTSKFGYNNFVKLEYTGTSKYPYVIIDSGYSLFYDKLACIYSYETYNDGLIAKDSIRNLLYVDTLGGPLESNKLDKVYDYLHFPGYYYAPTPVADTFFYDDDKNVYKVDVGDGVRVEFSNYSEITETFDVENPFWQANFKEIGYKNGNIYNHIMLTGQVGKLDFTQPKKILKTLIGIIRENNFSKLTGNSYHLNSKGQVDKMLFERLQGNPSTNLDFYIKVRLTYK